MGVALVGAFESGALKEHTSKGVPSMGLGIDAYI